jgi:hypothetical protein
MGTNVGANRQRRAVRRDHASALSGVPTRGHLVGWEAGRGFLVELGSGDVALAQSLVELGEAELRRAVAERQAVMMTFEDGDRGKPVILGLVARVPGQARAASPPEDFVVIKGQESIELRCGAASITLRKDGKVVLRGTTVISRATKENRIAGGTVHFN